MYIALVYRLNDTHDVYSQMEAETDSNLETSNSYYYYDESSDSNPAYTNGEDGNYYYNYVTDDGKYYDYVNDNDTQAEPAQPDSIRIENGDGYNYINEEGPANETSYDDTWIGVDDGTHEIEEPGNSSEDDYEVYDNATKEMNNNGTNYDDEAVYEIIYDDEADASTEDNDEENDYAVCSCECPLQTEGSQDEDEQYNNIDIDGNEERNYYEIIGDEGNDYSAGDIKEEEEMVDCYCECPFDENAETIPDAVTVRAEEAAPDAVTVRAEEATPDAATVRAEEATPDAVTVRAEEATPDAVTAKDQDLDSSSPVWGIFEETTNVVITSDASTTEEETQDDSTTVRTDAFFQDVTATKPFNKRTLVPGIVQGLEERPRTGPGFASGAVLSGSADPAGEAAVAPADRSAAGSVTVTTPYSPVFSAEDLLNSLDDK